MRCSLAVVIMVALATAVGCSEQSDAGKYWERFKQELSALVTVATGGRNPLPKPSTVASPSPGSAEYESLTARNTKANSELLYEVFKIVFMREPKDREEFGSLVDSLNQGATFEGVYNGFTHSSEFRKLEVANANASVEALRAFGEELAVLELELPEPTEFDASAALPLALPVNPGDDQVEVVEFGSAKPVKIPVAKLDAKTLGDRYSRQFVGASIYTLKRIIGDEAQKVVAQKKEYREKLARWYGAWAVHMARRNIDFGLELRANPDEQFHYRWALGANDDKVLWEVLNRLHRVLNEANGQKQ